LEHETGMRADEYIRFDATALAQRVQRRELTPIELVEAAIERIEALNPTLNAVVERAFEAARAAAAHIPITAPLAGVPFLAKDMNIEVAGLHLTESSRWLRQLPAATVDAPLAQRWRRAGLAILGRSNTPEFASEFVTEPVSRGATPNPWDRTRSPGGSSGGAAVAVASGMVPIAHGTDSGGSIRVPAALCGLVGLKPSRGWVPVGPQHDELVSGFDCEHVLSRSVRDSALALDVTAGPEPTTRYPISIPPVPFAAGLATIPPAARVGLALQAPGGIAPVDEIGAAVEEIAALLSRAGHHVSRFDYPPEANCGEAAAIIWTTAIGEEIDYFTRRIGRGPADDEIEPLSRTCAEQGRRYSAVEYVRARRMLSAATRAMVEACASIDYLLLPVTATHAVPTGYINRHAGPFSIERWNEDSYRFAPYTELFNITGQPAISLPLAQSGDNLPIGVQLVARLGEDAALLQLAAWLERERPWEAHLLGLRQRYLAPSP
jgi:amidase